MRAPSLNGRVLLRIRLLGLAVLVGLVGLSISCAPRDVAASEGEIVTPVEGGVLRMVLEDPVSLDPADADSVYSSLPVNQLFDGLVAVDPGMRILPALASRWEISRDGRTYTFHLRPAVRFHDGSLLTADDVVFTFERLLSPQHSQGNIASSFIGVVSGAKAFSEEARKDLPGVAAVDPLTVRIQLDRPYASFLQVLALDGLRVVPRRLAMGSHDSVFDRHPVGTGPFRLESWTADRLRLIANPSYFNGRPHLDAVEIELPPQGEKDLGTDRFRRGEIDVLEIPTAEALDALSQEPGIGIHRYQELNLSFLGLGAAHPPLDDVRIRRAIAYAIDREAIVSDSPRTRRLATGILPPGLQGYSPKPKALPYDPEASRRLLAEAGHPGGVGLEPVELLATSRTAASTRLAERVRSDLSAVGIRLDIHEVPWSILNQRIDSKTASMFKLSWIADVNDPDSFLRSLFEAGGSTNYCSFDDPETDALLRAGANELNPVERARIYRRAEERILALAPIVPLYHSRNAFATRRYVREMEPGPMGIAMLDLERVWFAGQKGRG